MRVVLTRPAGDAQPWADGLCKAGHEVLLLPLIDIQPPADLRPIQEAWAHLAGYRAVMFVSSNAVQFFMAQRPALYRLESPAMANLPRAWVTGPGSQQTLLQWGWPGDRVDAPPANALQFDSPALWAQVQSQVQPGMQVLLVRGAAAPQGALPQEMAQASAANQWMVQQLRQAGAQVDYCHAYQRMAPVFTATQTALAKVATGPGVVWLFSSSEGLAHLQQGLPGLQFQNTLALATHPRIAVHARALGFGGVRVVRPVLAQVIASIESMA